jgi:hypothetical protein
MAMTMRYLAFVGTTSLYLEGAGGQTLNQDSFGKNYRPDHCAHYGTPANPRDARCIFSKCCLAMASLADPVAK